MSAHCGMGSGPSAHHHVFLVGQSSLRIGPARPVAFVLECSFEIIHVIFHGSCRLPVFHLTVSRLSLLNDLLPTYLCHFGGTLALCLISLNLPDEIGGLIEIHQPWFI